MAKFALFAALIFATAGFSAEAQRRRVAGGPNGSSEFDCPDEFGYYPHPTDCTQYYVCVFGGALLESCTGGLMYSHELQTCDWPRNVGCGESAAPAAPSQGVSTVRVTDARTSGTWRSLSTPSTAPTRPVQQIQYEDIAAEEELVDRQQRVNRGQPNTVGQVARDRDGLRLSVTNAIPLSNSGRSVGDKNNAYVSQQQFTRPDPPASTVQAYVPTSPTPRTVIPVTNYTYDYEDYYEEYPQYQTTSGQQQQQQPLYRGQSPYKVQPTAPTAAPVAQQEYRPAPPSYAPVESAPAQPQYPVDTYDYDTYQNNDEVAYEPQPSPQPQPPTRQSNRVASSQKPPKETLTTSTSTTTTSTTTVRPTVAPEQPSRSGKQRALVRQQGRASNRGATKARISEYEAIDAGDEDLPSGGYDSDNRVSESPLPSRARPTIATVASTGNAQRSNTASTSSRGRGSVKAGSARPTLKPSKTIVANAAEYIDIYRFPPSRPEPIYPTPRVDQTAAKCRKDVCQLPDCYCGGKEVPAGFAPEQIPQIVLLTFDDSVNDLNKGLYQSLFERGRVNPNGCPISATFYVSHEWTDYGQVQNLYADGHEMASHSVSHSFGEQFSQKKWTREIAGQREILSAYGGVKLEDIRGMRAPFLAIGGNKMFKMLYDANFTYDSSMPVYENRPPSFPYTLDYKIFHDCMIPPCPTKSYPGVWEVPMVMWQDLNGGRCSMGDACSNPPTADGVYKMLIKNFERHYTTNRAPFGLYYHAAWFTQPHHKEGFEAFLDTIVAMDDVWLTTNWQALQWMRDPQPLSSVKNFAPFGCNYQSRPKRCNNPKVCNLWHKSGVRYMRTCQPCPDIYPWTGKTGVRNSRVDNNEIEE